MRKLFILQLLLFLLAFTVSPLFADIVTVVIDFEDETSLTGPTNSGIYRFTGNQNNGFYFSHIGILKKEEQISESHRGYYLGAAPESNYVGYSDNNRTVSIERPGETFTFAGGYFTPANFIQGWVNLIGYVNETVMYSILLDIKLVVNEDETYEPTYYDLEKDEYLNLLTGSPGVGVLQDITKLEIAPYMISSDDWKGNGEWWQRWISPNDTRDIQTKRNHQIVMDNLTFWVNVDANLSGETTPEPATIAALGLGMIGLLASRRKRKNA